MDNKQHLTESGLNEIVSRKSILNKGLNENLKVHFPKATIPIKTSSYIACSKFISLLSSWVCFRRGVFLY